MHRHNFYLDGVSSRDYGILCSGYKTMNAPKRDVQRIVVPGRNGELTIDNGRYLNIEVEYEAIFVYNFRQNIKAARAWLCQSAGYRRLEDDWHPESYRMARFTDGLELEVAPLYDAAKATLRFSCMPQRWLVAGEQPVSMTSGSAIINPTSFNSEPLIVVTGSGSGTVTIGSQTVSISDIGTSVTLDCALKRAYNGTTPRDSTISGSYPVLASGSNTVSWTGGVTGVTITPRWWTI